MRNSTEPGWSGHLGGAHLEGAYLGTANLDRADLGETKGLTVEQLQHALSLASAVLPDELTLQLAGPGRVGEGGSGAGPAS